MTAGTFRQDLVNAGKGNGYHGFSYATPSSLKDGNAHSISVKYAGASTNLSGSPKTLTCSGYASVSQGVSISANPVKLSQNFTISFTLKETRGAAKTFDNIAIRVTDPNGGWFDFAMFPSVTIPANGPKSYSYQNYIYTSRPTGTYKADVRGYVGGQWFVFDTVDSGVNPKSFSIVR